LLISLIFLFNQFYTMSDKKSLNRNLFTIANMNIKEYHLQTSINIFIMIRVSYFD
jgi:hypothetical protein